MRYEDATPLSIAVMRDESVAAISSNNSATANIQENRQARDALELEYKHFCKYYALILRQGRLRYHVQRKRSLSAI